MDTLNDQKNSILTLLAQGIGGAVILFFSITAMTAIKKITDKKPGITIDDHGIFDNSSHTSIGLIPWKDIKAISEQEALSSQFLVIALKSPNTYFKKATNGMQRNLMKTNIKLYGSPITISSKNLSIDFEELSTLLLKEWNQYS